MHLSRIEVVVVGEGGGGVDVKRGGGEGVREVGQAPPR